MMMIMQKMAKRNKWLKMILWEIESIHTKQKNRKPKKSNWIEIVDLSFHYSSVFRFENKKN